MDAERSRAVTEDEPVSPPDGEGGTSARRLTSAGDRVQATMAAADTAAEEILDAARAEARELIERAEQVATDRTAQLQTQAEILLTRANDLTRQAEALGEATRELTGSVNRVISIEAPAVTELELPSGEPEAGETPQLESAGAEVVEGEPEADAVLTEPEAVLAELGAIADRPQTQAAEPEQEQVEGEAEAPGAEAPAEEPEIQEAEVEPPADEAEAAEAAVQDATVVETPAPADTEAATEAPATDAEAPATEAQTAAPSPTTARGEPAAPRGTGSQPPPSTPKPEPPEQPEAAAPAEEPQGKKRRGLFSRLRRSPDAEQPEAPAPARRSRASDEAIAEVSPGHQMLARQMLLDGLSEADVERRLRDEFRVRDPGAVLDSLQLDTPMISPTKAEGDE